MRNDRKQITQCKQCSCDFTHPKHSRKRVFCSNECKLQYMRENATGIPFEKGRKAWNKGLRKENDERVRLNAVATSKGRIGKCIGPDNHFYGKHHSSETKKLIGSYHYVGAIHVAKGYYGRGFNKEAKMEIKIRDCFTCQECGGTQKEVTLAIHHIDYDTTNHHPSNLVTLCIACNGKANYKRGDWMKHFQALIRRKQLTLKKKGGDIG